MQAHRGEVENMFSEEFDYDRAMEISKEEAREEGLAEGKAEGRVESIKNLMDSLKLTAQQAMDVLKIPESDYSKYMAML